MNMLKRMISTSPLLLTCSISALMSISAQAGLVVPKPAPHGYQNAEMARALARAGTYTLAGADQETTTIPGEVIVAEPSQFQGAVYLFNGSSSTPERVYQFPGLSHTGEMAGSSVALSNQWAAFMAKPYNNSTTPPAQHDTSDAVIYIAGKTNGVWASCPTLNSVANNCNESFRDNGSGISKPITRIGVGSIWGSGGGFSAHEYTLAISDQYLAVANFTKSIVKFYRYNSSNNNWILEYNLDDEDYKTVGKAVAIYGDRIAVSSTWEGNTAASRGKVHIYQRNSSNGTWSVLSQVDADYGVNGTGNFGRYIQMDNATLVVASGAGGFNEGTRQLNFFALNSLGIPTSERYVVSVPKLNKMSLSGNSLAVSHLSSDPAITVYSRNTSSSTLEWKRTAGLNGDFYKNLNLSIANAGYTGADDIGLVGEDLSLGWRIFNPTTPNYFYGGVVQEKVSLLDTCRNPKNLVANCSFDNVTNTSLNNSASGNNWTFLNHNGGSGSVSYNDRQMRVSVYSQGYDMWHIQARTPVNLSQAVRYKLSFRAKADANRTFVVNIGHNGNQDNNWQSYGRETVYATTNWTEYSYEFQMPMDSNAFLDFNFGNAGTSAVTVDGVSLTAI